MNNFSAQLCLEGLWDQDHISWCQDSANGLMLCRLHAPRFDARVSQRGVWGWIWPALRIAQK